MNNHEKRIPTTVVMFLLCVVAILGVFFGAYLDRVRMEREAVKVGVAKWITGKSGGLKFVWITEAER